MSTPATRGGTTFLNPRPPTNPATLQTSGYINPNEIKPAPEQAPTQAPPGGSSPPTLPGMPATSALIDGAPLPVTPQLQHSDSAYINIARPNSYLLGGNRDYVPMMAGAAQQVGNAAAAQQEAIAGAQTGLAAQSLQTGERFGDDLANAGVTLGKYGQNLDARLHSQARTTATMGDQAFQQGTNVAKRAGPVANFGAQNDALGRSQGAVDQLLALEGTAGPSAAQAQLQAGLNAAADSNTSLARSGRGWGQSASALAQAGRNNAAMAGNAANQAAILRAQEDAAARQRAASNIATGAGIQQAAAQQFGTQAQANVQNALQAQQLNDATSTNLYNTALQAQQIAGAQQTAGGDLALRGLQSGAATTAQAGQLQLAGQGQASQMAQAAAGNYATGAQQQQNALTFSAQLAQQQLAAGQAYEQARLQEYGIRKGVAIQQAANTANLIGAGISAAGSGATALAMMSDVRAKERIKPMSAVEALLSPEDSLLAGDQRTGEALDADEDPFYGSYASYPSRTGEDLDSADSMRAAAAPTETYQGPDRDEMATHMRSGAESRDRFESNESRQLAKRRAGLSMMAEGFGAFRRVGGGGTPGLDFIERYGRPVTSDEREKRDVRELERWEYEDHDRQRRNDLRPARGYSYEYKDPARHGRGRFYGPMAQDLLKTPAGKSSVVRQPDGSLGVDTGRLALATVPAVAEQQSRQDEVDERVSALERLLSEDMAEQRGRRTAENSHLPKARRVA